MVGACIGFVGVIGVRVLVLGDSFDGLHSKFAETGMLETVGISLLAILIRGRKINCVMRRFFPSSSVGDRPAPRGCTSTPDERKVTTI